MSNVVRHDVDSCRFALLQKRCIPRRALLFVALCFALSWSACWISWLQKPGSAFAQLASLVMSAGPGLAAMICVFTFDRGKRMAMLGLSREVNGWWLFAYLVAIAFSFAVFVTTVLGGRVAFVPPPRTLQFAISFLVVNPLVQSLMATFMEEIGWRGYLYALWRRVGFWQFSLGSGLLWGIWHVPGIALLGVNYPEHPWRGAVIFILYCTLLSPFVTLVRDRSGSTVAAGIFHGTLNATAYGITTMLENPSPSWAGSTGLGGIAGITLTVAFVLIVRRMSSNNATREDARA